MREIKIDTVILGETPQELRKNYNITDDEGVKLYSDNMFQFSSNLRNFEEIEVGSNYIVVKIPVDEEKREFKSI